MTATKGSAGIVKPGLKVISKPERAPNSMGSQRSSTPTQSLKEHLSPEPTLGVEDDVSSENIIFLVKRKVGRMSQRPSFIKRVGLKVDEAMLKILYIDSKNRGNKNFFQDAGKINFCRFRIHEM